MTKVSQEKGFYSEHISDFSSVAPWSIMIVSFSPIVKSALVKGSHDIVLHITKLSQSLMIDDFLHISWFYVFYKYAFIIRASNPAIN